MGTEEKIRGVNGFLKKNWRNRALLPHSVNEVFDATSANRRRKFMVHAVHAGCIANWAFSFRHFKIISVQERVYSRLMDCEFWGIILWHHSNEESRTTYPLELTWYHHLVPTTHNTCLFWWLLNLNGPLVWTYNSFLSRFVWRCYYATV